jgi:hypothetical protein
VDTGFRKKIMLHAIRWSGMTIQAELIPLERGFAQGSSHAAGRASGDEIATLTGGFFR